MVTQVLDFVEGHVPTTGDHTFSGIITLILMSPYIYGIFLYIMQALGLYRIAKRRGIHLSWLAWIPCGREWLLGSISDHYQYIVRGKHRHSRFLFLILSVLTTTAIFLSGVLTWELPLSILNIVYSDFLRTFLHIPLIAGNLLPTTGGLLIALTALRLIPLSRLYQSSLPKHRILLLILNVLLPFSQALTIFAVRDCDKGMPPKHQSIPGMPSQPEC